MWELRPVSGRGDPRPYIRATGFATGDRGEVETALEACEQLAIHYEHRAREPERAAEFTRAGLAALGNARIARSLEPGRQRRWQARFLHRLGRLVRAGEKDPRSEKH